MTRLEELSAVDGTQVLLESTHRIERLLEQVLQLMPLTQVVLAKELTKRHETFIRGTAQECLQVFAQDPLLKKGEFVVLLYQQKNSASDSSGMDGDSLLKLLLAEMPLKKAVKLAVSISGQKKNDLYKRALEVSKN